MKYLIFSLIILTSLNAFAEHKVAQAISHIETGDISRAVELLNEAEEERSRLSSYASCARYVYGVQVEKDVEQAFLLCRKSAEEGVGDAQVVLGAFYEKGVGVSVDLERSLYWYEEAAKQMNLYGLQNAARLRSESPMPSQINFEKSLEYIKAGIEKNDPYAQNLMAVAYVKSKGVEKSYKKAVFWWKKAAEQGLPEAINSLGVSYCRGRGVRQDREKGLELIKKAISEGFDFAKQFVHYCDKPWWEFWR